MDPELYDFLTNLQWGLGGALVMVLLIVGAYSIDWDKL